MIYIINWRKNINDAAFGRTGQPSTAGMVSDPMKSANEIRVSERKSVFAQPPS